ncbi:iron chelate uptake ABC transporter family permease subunit [Proteus sp. FZP2095]|uniref:iron chelate uptake ABC transporter family permease subunit n=1 Tax=Proteus sp. FZP2095 TaxID=2950158 RepID=UPI002033857A|nr:iron chelate uptake ABC transporter family permease subunit [Proteus sp. FZP2095]MCM2366146.1 iron chelate uptake ABC transporter family permease subunit [Proteus sp. FZP2095]
MVEGSASARGLHTEHASIILLIIVLLLCALVSSTVGPIAFIGLVAPHMACLKNQIAIDCFGVNRWNLNGLG